MLQQAIKAPSLTNTEPTNRFQPDAGSVCRERIKSAADVLNPECEVLDRSKFDTTKIAARNKDTSSLLQSITSKKISTDSAASPQMIDTTGPMPDPRSLTTVLEDLMCLEK